MGTFGKSSRTQYVTYFGNGKKVTRQSTYNSALLLPKLKDRLPERISATENDEDHRRGTQHQWCSRHNDRDHNPDQSYNQRSYAIENEPRNRKPHHHQQSYYKVLHDLATFNATNHTSVFRPVTPLFERIENST